jgi:hypothetical protein
VFYLACSYDDLLRFEDSMFAWEYRNQSANDPLLRAAEHQLWGKPRHAASGILRLNMRGAPATMSGERD